MSGIVARSAFDHWLRTGQLLDSIQKMQRMQRKFNPYHDPDDGRFTFAPGNGGSLSARSASTRSPSARPAPIRGKEGPKERHPDPIAEIIERELASEAKRPNAQPTSELKLRSSRAKAVLTHWPIAGGSGAMLNRPDKRGEGGPRYGDQRSRGKHGGIDIKAPEGTPVRVAGNGVIVAIRPNPSASFGVQVVVYHGNGLYTHYAHLRPGSAKFKPGTRVNAGSYIGQVGRTGNTPRSGDAHLHFEVRLGSSRPASAGGRTMDPLKNLPVSE